jgi:hypothetical protein
MEKLCANRTRRGFSARDTRIFSRDSERLRLYFSKSYRDVRYLICMAMQDDAEQVHAKLTQPQQPS